MRTLTTTTALLLTFALTSPLLAQAPTEFTGPYPSSSYTTPTFPTTPTTSIHRHTSTYPEALGKAVSYIIDSVARGNLTQAQAEILLQEAIARQYQNRVTNTETFLHRRRLLDEDREARRHQKWERREAALAMRASREETELRTTYRPPISQLDPFTGEITWPAAFDRPEFCEVAADLNSLFNQLAEDGAQGDRLYRDPINDLCEELSDSLRRNRKALCIDWADYFEAQKLIVGLKYQAEYWPGEAAAGHRLVASR